MYSVCSRWIHYSKCNIWRFRILAIILTVIDTWIVNSVCCLFACCYIYFFSAVSSVVFARAALLYVPLIVICVALDLSSQRLLTIFDRLLEGTLPTTADRQISSDETEKERQRIKKTTSRQFDIYIAMNIKLDLLNVLCVVSFYVRLGSFFLHFSQFLRGNCFKFD